MADSTPFPTFSTFRYHYSFDVLWFSFIHFGFSGLGLSRYLGFYTCSVFFLVHQGFLSVIRSHRSGHPILVQEPGIFLGSRSRQWYSYPTCQLHAGLSLHLLKVESAGPRFGFFTNCFYKFFLASAIKPLQAAALYLVNLCHYQFRPQKRLHVCMLLHSSPPRFYLSRQFLLTASHFLRLPAHADAPRCACVVTTRILDFL